MSEPFGSPAIEFHPAPELTPAGQREHHTVVIGEQLPARIRAWLNTQPWYGGPLPSIPDLVEHARYAEWTTREWARSRRIAWLWVIATPARVAPWLVLRAWKTSEVVSLGDEMPAISAVAERAPWPVAAGYAVTSVSAQIAESAPRAGIAALIGWCGANAAGWPQQVTVAYWWQKVAELWTHLTASTAHATGHVAPGANQVISGIGQVLFIAAVIGAYMLVRRINNKRNQS